MAGDVLQATRGPWKGGYTSAVPPFLAAPDQLVGNTDGTDSKSSRDCVIDPFTGGVSRRQGCSILNDTSGQVETTGLLNHSYSARCRRLMAIDSKSLTSGYPTLCGLWGTDDNSGFPTTDTGFKTNFWLNSHNSGASTNALKNYNLLEEFSTTHYAGTFNGSAVAADYKLRVVPIWYESGDGVYNRGALTGTAGTDKFMQNFLLCGSRSLLQTQNWMYAPNLRATPWRWNKRFNEATGSGSEEVRIFPTGPLPPLVPPTPDTLPAASANNSTWASGDTFYVSVMFQFEDGSYSMPFIPRAIQSGSGATPLGSGLGLVLVDSIGGGNKYQYIPYKNIPLGPEGTVARIILRTPKQNRTAAGDTITISPLDLRIVGVLRNNTQTTYNDFAGDDDSLLEDDDVVRFDWTMPRRSRYIGTGDQRVLISYTLPNTAAILIAPVGVSASRDRNFLDTDASCYNGSAAFFVRITSSQLELHYNATAGPSFGGGGNATALAFATYTTLESLVDAINATSTASNCKQWAAQLAPGIDGSLPSSYLTLTTMDVAVTGSGTTLTGTATAIAPIGIGMKVSGTNITAGTYVVSKPTSTTMTISAAVGGALGATSTFYQETGDNGVVTGGTLGYIRVFSQTYPLLLHVKPSSFPDYATPDKSSVYFTVSSPGSATNGISLAPNSWVAGNRRLPHSSPRQLHARSCVGIVDIEGAALVAYTDGIHLFENRRGANSGEDFDYRLFTINDTRGCVSYLGLVSGNGWAAYATPEGVMATDKNKREFSIGADLYNPTDNTGDLSYELTQSGASAASDSDDQHLVLGVMGSKLICGFRKSGANARFCEYDFSPGIEASGVEELINPETKRAYIWSPPAIYNNDTGAGLNLTPGAVGSIKNASGRIDYISYDNNTGTNSGVVHRIHTGSSDNSGAAYNADAVMAPVIASEFNMLSPQIVELVHRSLSAVVGDAFLYFANDQTPHFYTSAQTLSCGTTLDSTTVTSAALFGDVTGGMTVSGTGIAAGTIVERKVDASTVILSIAATATNNPVSLTFTPSQANYRRLLRDGTDTATNTNIHFFKQRIPVDSQQRGIADMFWAMWRSTALPSTALADRVYRMVLRYGEVEARD